MNWTQLGTVLWLRWRLSWNQWSRGGQFSAVITVILAILGVLLGLAGGIGGAFAGYLLLAPATPAMHLLVWDALLGAFLFFWVLSVLSELQRSELIDLGRLLHLPLSLHGIFFVNYLASHVSLNVFLFVPGMLGLSLGLALANGPEFLLMVPLVLGCIFTVTAWTYCLRGWLITLMVNQRRRRAIIMGIGLCIVLLSQLPNLYFNVIERPRSRGADSTKQAQRAEKREAWRKLAPNLIAAHDYIPPLWVGKGAMELAQGRFAPALAASLGLAFIGAIGLRRAYRATLKFYRDESRQSKKKTRPTAASRSGNWLNLEPPAIPEPAATLTLAFLRNMSRAPEIKMALLSNFLILILLGGSMLMRAVGSPNTTLAPFLASGAVVFCFLGLLPTMFNQFGFDREGFRILVLLAAPREQVLLAKNLAFAPVAVAGGFLVLALIAVLAHLPLLHLLAAACQLAAGFLLLSVIGNYVSIMWPYRVAIGSLKPTKVPGMTKLMLFFAHILFPVIMVPIFIPTGLGVLVEHYGAFPGGIVNFALSAILTVAVGWLYWLSLSSLGGLMERREKEILRVVTTEVE